MLRGGTTGPLSPCGEVGGVEKCSLVNESFKESLCDVASCVCCSEIFIVAAISPAFVLTSLMLTYIHKKLTRNIIISGTENLKTSAFEAAKISQSASKRFMSDRSLHLSCKFCSFHLTEYVKTTVLLFIFKKYKIDTCVHHFLPYRCFLDIIKNSAHSVHFSCIASSSTSTMIADNHTSALSIGSM